MPDTIRELLEEILAKYNKAREQEPFGKSHPIWSVFKVLQNHIKFYVDKKYPTIKVNWSIGQGNWARIPWIAFLDERETSTTQKGIEVNLDHISLRKLIIKFMPGQNKETNLTSYIGTH